MEGKRQDGRLADPPAQTLRNDFARLKHKGCIALKLLIRALSGMLQYNCWVGHNRPGSLYP